MTIVAFLQHLWVKDPDRVRAIIARGGTAARRRVVRTTLFGGCLTGRRLLAAFGQDLCDRIIWEEASPEIAGDAKTIFKPDHEHIRTVIGAEDPGLVITFGRMAFAAVDRHCNVELIRAPHPAARRADTVARLRSAADRVRSFQPLNPSAFKPPEAVSREL